MTDNEFLGGTDRTVADCKSKFDNPLPFAGCIGVLEGMIDDGSLDRFNDAAEARMETIATIAARNAGVPVMVIFADGGFAIYGEADALIMAACEPDYLTHIPVSAVKAAITKAYN